MSPSLQPINFFVFKNEKMENIECHVYYMVYIYSAIKYQTKLTVRPSEDGNKKGFLYLDKDRHMV